ncbi:family 43 glycosylhydrolase, partial [Micromonospora matsumotoense]|uniref:family 43 glycosylhydrolase n=1 Tax=Micromonospora matsumotoense TaxID=121616 RepID=UPI0033EB2C7E
MTTSVSPVRTTPTLRRLAVLSLSVAVLAAGGAAATQSPSAASWTAAPRAAATPTTPPGSYPGPGRVAGDVGVHDPTIVIRPGGGYLLAHTGDNIALKTSTDRTAFRNAGAVFPGGAPWTTTYTGGSRNLWAPDLSYRDGRYWLY